MNTEVWDRIAARARTADVGDIPDAIAYAPDGPPPRTATFIAQEPDDPPADSIASPTRQQPPHLSRDVPLEQDQRRRPWRPHQSNWSGS